MAETQDPSIGWGGEVHLHNGTALYELVQVVSFQLPNDEIEDVETTHLKSPGRRRQYISGLKTGGEVEVVLNYRPGSDTDALLTAAKAEGDSRAIRFIVPDAAGDPAWQIDTFATVKGVDRGTITAGEKMEVTVTLRIDADQDEEAAA